jgi:hybrid cluster-associated redox disulfide protein
MDATTRGFIYASLAYLGIGALLGVGVGVAPETFLAWRFVHVHLLLLGFMAMMVYGVGYFILPRFNATTLRWPGLLLVHFWTANVGLLGMCATYDGLLLPAGVDGRLPFAVFAVTEVISVLLFVANLWATIAATQPGPAHPVVPATPRVGKSAEPPPAPPAYTFALDSLVTEVLQRQPAAAQILRRRGVEGLDDPKILGQMERFKVTLERLATTQGLAAADLLAEINRGAPTVSPTAAPLKLNIAPGTVATTGGPCGPNDVIGEVLARYPETTAVFQERFGAGCFSCPGQASESIAQAAMMHNIDPAELVAALNRVAGDQQ